MKGECYGQITALVEEVDVNFDARAIYDTRRTRVSSIPHFFSVFKGKNVCLKFEARKSRLK